WLSLAAFVQPIGNSLGWIFLASGRAGAMMRSGIATCSVLTVDYVIGVQWGAEGVAAAYFIVLLMILPFLFAYAVRGTALSVTDLYGVCIPPLVASGLIYGAIKLWIS